MVMNEPNTEEYQPENDPAYVQFLGQIEEELADMRLSDSVKKSLHEVTEHCYKLGMLRALEATIEMTNQEWRPIEEMPDKGTVLVWLDDGRFVVMDKPTMTMVFIGFDDEPDPLCWQHLPLPPVKIVTVDENDDGSSSWT